MFKNIRKTGPLETVPSEKKLNELSREEVAKVISDALSIQPITFLEDNEANSNTIMGVPLRIQTETNYNTIKDESINQYLPLSIIYDSIQASLNIQLNNMVNFINSFTVQCFTKFINESKFISLYYYDYSIKKFDTVQAEDELVPYLLEAINDKFYITGMKSILNTIHGHREYDHSLNKGVDQNGNANEEFMNTIGAISMNISNLLIQHMSSAVCLAVNNWLIDNVYLNTNSIIDMVNKMFTNLKHPVRDELDLAGFLNEALSSELYHMIYTYIKPNIDIVCINYSQTLYYIYNDMYNAKLDKDHKESVGEYVPDRYRY